MLSVKYTAPTVKSTPDNTRARGGAVTLSLAHELACLDTAGLQEMVHHLAGAVGWRDADRRRRLALAELARRRRGAELARLLRYVEDIGGNDPQDARSVAAMLGWLALPSDTTLTPAGRVALAQLDAQASRERAS